MIAKQTSVIHDFLGQPNSWYLEKETGRKFRRIYSGLQWPGNKPGAIIVLAEDLGVDAALDERKLWILAEYENRNQSELIDRCDEFKGLMQVEKFYGDTTNRPMMILKNRSKTDFNLSKAPFIDQPTAHEAYLSIIREKTSVTRKVLNFGESSALPAILASVDSVPSGNSFKTDFPSVAALSYALSAMVVRAPEKPMPYMPTFGVLDEGVGY